MYKSEKPPQPTTGLFLVTCHHRDRCVVCVPQKERGLGHIAGPCSLEVLAGIVLRGNTESSKPKTSKTMFNQYAIHLLLLTNINVNI